MKKLKCAECGNTKKFYRTVSVSAKQIVNAKGEDLKKLEITGDIDNNFEGIFCYECDTEIEDEEN